jgi:ABC-type transporter Mla subunit MlaD
MKYATASIALAVAALLTGHAQAADNSGKTREQVRAELAQAQRTGDVLAGKDAGFDEFNSGAFKKLNELNPAAYPAKVAEAGKTRAQVLAELAEARRTGDIQAGKDAGFDEFNSGAFKKLNELNPTAYPAKVSESGKTRAQVLAELAEAQRTGDIVADKDAGDEFSTANGRKMNEIYPSFYPTTRVN